VILSPEDKGAIRTPPYRDSGRASSEEGTVRLAKVVGQVVSTVKEPGLDSFKILLVEDLDPNDPEREPFDGPRFRGVPEATAYPAIDVVGAGEGEVVLVATGSAARIPAPAGRTPTDASVVAIVDSVIVGGEVTFKK
jgi:ethanolamine utilization protein EutN